MTAAGSTAARRREVRRLVKQHHVGSQGQLVALLAEAGYPVTQATVSRDLDAVGAARQHEENGYRYLLVADEGEAEGALDHLARLVAEFVGEITPSGNLVVLRTPPGAAQVVASAIDNAGIPGLLGTVAGDDTVLAVAEDKVGGWRLAKNLERIGAGR